MQTEIRHVPDKRRFETTVDGALCVAEYRLENGAMLLTHTEVAPAFGAAASPGSWWKRRSTTPKRATLSAADLCVCQALPRAPPRWGGLGWRAAAA